MKSNNFYLSILFLTLLLSSCATSMTPTEVTNTLPNLTNAVFYNQTQAIEAKNSKKCKILVEGRNYNAPIGFTTKDDLKNGARGIDEWVKLDGGNAYVLVNYKWITIDQNGVTQLQIDFDTMQCK